MTRPAEGRVATDAAPPADLDRLQIDRSSPTLRRRSRRRPLLWVAVVLAVAAAGLAWAATRGMFAPQVRTAMAARVAATEGAVRTTASGYVVARTRAAISSRMSGRLERITVDVGDHVEKGQLIAELGHADLDASVEQARAEVAHRRSQVEASQREAAAARAATEAASRRLGEADAGVREMESRLADAVRTFAREEDLRQGGHTTPEAVDRARMERDVHQEKLAQSKAAVETARAEETRVRLDAEASEARARAAESAVASAEAAVRYAQALRSDADIVAPFAGIVLRKEAEVGEMVAPVNSAGSMTRGAVVTLADFGSLEMEVDVIERDIGLVTAGAPCRIVLDSRRDSPYAGSVRQIVPTADRTKSTVLVKVVFATLDEHVFPEMSGRVEFLKPGAEAAATARDRVMVPAEARVRRDDKDGVFVVRDGVVTFLPVTFPGDAATAKGPVEVADGLAGGEEVVISPPARLATGDSVRVEEAAP